MYPRPPPIVFRPGMVLACTCNSENRVTVASVKKGIAVMTDRTRMGADGYLRVRGIGHVLRFAPVGETP